MYVKNASECFQDQIFQALTFSRYSLREFKDKKR